MKDLITAVASLALLLAFVLQFSAGQVLTNRMLQADLAVETFRDGVKEQGFVSGENAAALENALSRVLGCGREDVLVSGTESLVAEGGLVHYRIGYPLENIIAAGRFFGIAEEENRAWHEEEGWVVSKFEEPDYNSGDSPADDSGDDL